MPPLSRAEAEIARVLRERVVRLRAGLLTLTQELLEPISLGGMRTPGGDPLEPVPGFLAEAVRGLASSGDQIALLDRLLEGASRCFSRVCLFIVRREVAHGWSSVGLPETEEGDPAKGLTVTLRKDSILSQAVEARKPIRNSASAESIHFLPPLRPGDRVPENALAVPMVIQDKVAALLYADDGGDGRAVSDFGSAEILVGVAALAANLLALLSHPEPPEMDARADVEIRIPPPEEGGGLAPGPDLFETDSLEDELLGSEIPASPPASPGDLGPEEARLHHDARRFARLLVSELLLYHEDLVIQGRKHRDIYSRLKLEIDRSRQAYDQRVPRSVSVRADYFTQELVRTLAGGDPSALGHHRTP